MQVNKYQGWIRWNRRRRLLGVLWRRRVNDSRVVEGGALSVDGVVARRACAHAVRLADSATRTNQATSSRLLTARVTALARAGLKSEITEAMSKIE
jgi:hypothetical protein